jgi:hypothetical protein
MDTQLESGDEYSNDFDE